MHETYSDQIVDLSPLKPVENSHQVCSFCMLAVRGGCSQMLQHAYSFCEAPVVDGSFSRLATRENNGETTIPRRPEELRKEELILAAKIAELFHETTVPDFPSLLKKLEEIILFAAMHNVEVNISVPSRARKATTELVAVHKSNSTETQLRIESFQDLFNMLSTPWHTYLKQIRESNFPQEAIVREVKPLIDLFIVNKLRSSHEITVYGLNNSTKIEMREQGNTLRERIVTLLYKEFGLSVKGKKGQS